MNSLATHLCIATLTAKSNAAHVSDTTCTLCFSEYPSNLALAQAVAGDGAQDTWVALVDSMESVDTEDYEDEFDEDGAVTFNCEVDGNTVGYVTLTKHPLY